MDITVLSGSQIPKKASGDKDIVDPYVTVQLYSASTIDLLKTEVVSNNGLNPVWDCKGSFEYIEGEVNLLVLRVLDDDHTLLAWNALPVEHLRKGYRAVTLKGPKLETLEVASLLCLIKF